MKKGKPPTADGQIPHNTEKDVIVCENEVKKKRRDCCSAGERLFLLFFFVDFALRSSYAASGLFSL